MLSQHGGFVNRWGAQAPFTIGSSLFIYIPAAPYGFSGKQTGLYSMYSIPHSPVDFNANPFSQPYFPFSSAVTFLTDRPSILPTYMAMVPMMTATEARAITQG